MVYSVLNHGSRTDLFCWRQVWDCGWRPRASRRAAFFDNTKASSCIDLCICLHDTIRRSIFPPTHSVFSSPSNGILQVGWCASYPCIPPWGTILTTKSSTPSFKKKHCKYTNKTNPYPRTWVMDFPTQHCTGWTLIGRCMYCRCVFRTTLKLSGVNPQIRNQFVILLLLLLSERQMPQKISTVLWKH